MENINDAANALYQELKQYEDFANTSVIEEPNKLSIMILLVEETPKILGVIPLTYKGFPVCYEVTGEFRFY